MGNFYTKCCNNSILNTTSNHYIFSENPNKLAITISIDYKNSNENLGESINNLNSINQFLLEKCNFCSSNIITLYNEEATKKNIKAAINKMVEFSHDNENAELWFSFFGNGCQINSFIENTGKNKVLLPSDFNESGFISDNWLNYNLVNSLSETSNLFVLMDCCNSNNNLILPYTFINNKIIKTNKPYKQLANIIKIGLSDEISFEITENQKPGILANAFIETNNNQQFINRIKNIINFIDLDNSSLVPNLSFSKPELLHWILYKKEFEIFI